MACIGAGGVVLAAAGGGTAGAVAGGIGATAVADRGAVGTTVALVDLGLAAVAALGALAAGRVRGRPPGSRLTTSRIRQACQAEGHAPVVAASGAGRRRRRGPRPVAAGPADRHAARPAHTVKK